MPWHWTTDGVTGSNGPALILRSVFAELNRHQDTRPLYLSPRLVTAVVCRDSGLPADGGCASLSEWFVPGTEPHLQTVLPGDAAAVYLSQPTQGMQLAMDPRIEEADQAFVFKLANLPENASVDWYVDDQLAASTPTGEYLWTLQPGTHSVSTRIRQAASGRFQNTAEVSFTVK